jgi:hypothetical protein
VGRWSLIKDERFQKRKHLSQRLTTNPTRPSCYAFFALTHNFLGRFAQKHKSDNNRDNGHSFDQTDRNKHGGHNGTPGLRLTGKALYGVTGNHTVTNTCTKGGQAHCESRS